MIVILSEEASMRATLVALFTRYYPSLVEGIHWQIIAFQGKADLEKNFPHKMRSWSYLSPHFIILRDNDGADCTVLKERLRERARTTGKPYHIRLVCQELEAWLLGDMEAIQQAYPHSRATNHTNTARFRNPDSLGNPSEELAKITGVSSKTAKAHAIAPHLDSSRIQSHSFQVFWKTIAHFFPESALQL
ncbi:DUF4276 family protein [Roseibacillus persicicus]|uniref:DUF4276 family protein n=1 Tax=Roseibacillus persicicus TaxID=454148 RepID=A0A918WG27_9BACT|nr:DUF4276 family protein [Roseibacillus persicicus]GHC41205.1 hypothetical protein GCM10007100_02340 [Roseibacillus persicicus]